MSHLGRERAGASTPARTRTTTPRQEDLATEPTDPDAPGGINDRARRRVIEEGGTVAAEARRRARQAVWSWKFYRREQAA